MNDAEADLKNLHYGLRSFLVSGTSVNYDVGTAGPAEGFDPSHIALLRYSYRTRFDVLSRTQYECCYP